MNGVTFIDTSVLCNIVPVPGRDQDAAMVKEQLKARLQTDVFILPITAVIETGNFVAQLSDGRVRRATAEKLANILRLVCEGKAPWTLHNVRWDMPFLARLLDGADTGVDIVMLAEQQLGLGDLCILTERQIYEANSRIKATIWSLDAQLNAYSPQT